MFRIEKVEENNKQRVINFLQLDVIRHVFAFYDIQREPEHTTMYAAFENGSLKGYVLIYTALEFPSVILECENDTAEKLIEYARARQLCSSLACLKRPSPPSRHGDVFRRSFLSIL